jgi:NADPH2:quinone reductase
LHNSAWEEVPTPTAGAGEALVELQFASLNPADNFQIHGRYPGGPEPPFIAGRDGAGAVVSGGAYPSGTPVLVLQANNRNLVNGTFAERQRFPVDVVAPLPEGWSFAEGAAAPLVYLTAWQALAGGVGIGSGTVVVASGGVGVAAVHLARALGAIVVALSRSPKKRDRLLEIGAHHAFDPEHSQIKKTVFDAVGKKGVDVVVETVGGALLGIAVHLLAPRGRVAVLGVLGGNEGTVPIPSLMFKRATIEGILVSTYTPAEAQAAWAGIVATLAKANARPIVDSIFTPPNIKEAFARLAEGPFGKVVLDLTSLHTMAASNRRGSN